MNAKEASATFDHTVLDLLTENHTLKRYSEERDRRRRAMAGESV